MSTSRILSCSSLTVIAILLAACGQGTDSTVAENPAGAVRELPDWTGWWAYVDGPLSGGVRSAIQEPGVYQPEAQRLIDARAAGANAAGSAAAYCLPTRFNGGSNGGGTNDVEFLLMPERLTITNGDGLLRRIPIDGRPLRVNPEPSNGGTSIGRWEGDTLVVETIGLHPDTTFPTPSRPNLPQIGENVHVLERIRLNEDDQLVVETLLTAPELFIDPLEFTIFYRRDPGYVYRDHDVCSLNDRSIDPVTGLERFDMTPPPDLPPPPPRP